MRKMPLKFILSVLSFFLLSAFCALDVSASTSQWQDLSGQGGKGGLINLKKGGETDICAAANGKIYATFQDNAKQARARVYNNGVWSDLADQNNPQGHISQGKAANSYLETKEGEVYVAFTEYSQGKKVRVKKWDGSTWSNLADNYYPDGLISTGEGIEPILAFDKSQQNLYAAFLDNGLGGRTKIIKWNAIAGWSDVGVAGLLGNLTSAEVDLAASKIDDSIFAAFEDFSNGRRIRVQKWNGSSWQNVSDGNHPDGIVSSGEAYSPSLAVDANDNIYLVYGGKKQKGTYVKKWDGQNWSDPGGGVLIKGRSKEGTAEVDLSGNVYVALSQKIGGLYWEVLVKRWNGDGWSDTKYRGKRYLTRGKGMGDPSLSFANNELFISFTDAKHKNRPRVMELSTE
jgi:hypothetical protein